MARSGPACSSAGMRACPTVHAQLRLSSLPRAALAPIDEATVPAQRSEKSRPSPAERGGRAFVPLPNVRPPRLPTPMAFRRTVLGRSTSSKSGASPASLARRCTASRSPAPRPRPALGARPSSPADILVSSRRPPVRRWLLGGRGVDFSCTVACGSGGPDGWESRGRKDDGAASGVDANAA